MVKAVRKSSTNHTAIDIDAPRPATPKKPAPDATSLRAIINSLLLLVVVILFIDILGGHPFLNRLSSLHISHTSTTQTESAQLFLNCDRRIKLHNAFPTLCKPYQPGVVYSARFGGLGGWELEASQSGEFGDSFHVFDSAPLVSEKQTGIKYYPIGLGPFEQIVELAPPPRIEKSYMLLTNSTAARKKVDVKRILRANVQPLETIMKRMKHKKLSILRMDLGGLELLIIDEWWKRKSVIPIDQVVIRFNKEAMKFRGTPQASVNVATRKMHDLGYRPVDSVEGVS